MPEFLNFMCIQAIIVKLKISEEVGESKHLFKYHLVQESGQIAINVISSLWKMKSKSERDAIKNHLQI